MPSKLASSLSIIFLALNTNTALADPPPDPISIDAHSPSIGGACGKTTADIYGVSPLPIGLGCDVGGPGPVLEVPDFGYGLNTNDESDGHSNGERDPHAPIAVYFSGDRASQGLPGTHYDAEETVLQAAGDRYVTNGLVMAPPAAVISGGVCSAPTMIGPPVVPGGSLNILSLNQDRYSEIPSIRPGVVNRRRVLDNLDALELTPFDRDGDGVHDTPIYFTVDRVSPSHPGMADILYSPPASPFFNVFAYANQMGLARRDDLDAIAVWDMNRNGVADPGMDYVLFSLARGSSTLIAGGFSAADLFVSDFMGRFCLYLPAQAIGMDYADNVDAVDVEINEVEIWEDLVVTWPSDGVDGTVKE